MSTTNTPTLGKASVMSAARLYDEPPSQGHLSDRTLLLLGASHATGGAIVAARRVQAAEPALRDRAVGKRYPSTTQGHHAPAAAASSPSRIREPMRRSPQVRPGTTTTHCGSMRDKTDETTDNRKIMANSSPAPSRGRPVDPNSTSGKIRTLLATGMSQADIVKKLGCAQSLVYSVKARMEGGGKPRKSGRGPGRPPKAKAKAASNSSSNGLSGILEMVKRNEAERTRLLGALEKVAAAVREALA
ncbi:MAG: hypothetical protein JNL12_01825 [Planctomycetes bacterium]|nr:hypothetical protein [Planctomycetota bacterium]